jgi:hypothetical protein
MRKLPEAERFIAQAVAIGEVEWNPKGIDEDFEKLMVADAMVLFMVFEKGSCSEADAELDHLEGAVRRRHEYFRVRGIMQPPIFLLSCWMYPKGRFVHRQI